MGKVLPFRDEKDRYLDTLLVHLNEMAAMVSLYQELFIRSSKGEAVFLGNPDVVNQTISRIQKTVLELRGKGYGKSKSKTREAYHVATEDE